MACREISPLWLFPISVPDRHAQGAAEQAIAGHHLISVRTANRPVPKFATCAFNDQPTGGNIPQTDSTFDIRIKAATGHVSKPERGRPHHADFSDPADQLIEIWQGGLETGFTFGEANRNNRFAQIPHAADLDYPAIQARFFAANGCPRLGAKRIKNHADDSFIPVGIIRSSAGYAALERNGNAGMGDASGKINRPIDGMAYQPTVA